MFKMRESLVAGNGIKVECEALGIIVFEDVDDYSNFGDQAADVAAYHAKIRIAEIFKDMITNRDHSKIDLINTEYRDYNDESTIHIEFDDGSWRDFKLHSDKVVQLVADTEFIGKRFMEFEEACKENKIELE